jgi:hypothetical protein
VRLAGRPGTRTLTWPPVPGSSATPGSATAGGAASGCAGSGCATPGNSGSGSAPAGSATPGSITPDSTQGSAAAGRDRDSAGRPRSARPRDELGRPLSRGAAGGAPPSPDEPALPPAAALALAQQLIDRGQPFRAHEVLEASWKAAPPAERDLWQGLAQVAVGLTHARRGNARGAVTLLRRGADAISGYAGACPHGIDAAGIAGSACGLADAIEAGGLAAVPPGRLLIRLSR